MIIEVLLIIWFATASILVLMKIVSFDGTKRLAFCCNFIFPSGENEKLSTAFVAFVSEILFQASAEHWNFE